MFDITMAVLRSYYNYSYVMREMRYDLTLYDNALNGRVTVCLDFGFHTFQTYFKNILLFCV